jgi:hypothetical protein
MVLKLGHFEKQMRQNCKVLNMVMEKNGEEDLVRICKELGSFHGVKEDRNIIHT